MRIVLPWPDKRLTPNAKRRTHWRTYQPAIKSDRLTAHLLTIQAMDGRGRPDFGAEGKIPLRVTFYPPDMRHRDDDGMVGAFKHFRDGIADALFVDDRRFAPHYFFAEPEKPGRVEVELSTSESTPEACDRSSSVLQMGRPGIAASTAPRPDQEAMEVPNGSRGQ